MPLNLGGGGDFTPHIRWNASTSSWTMAGEDGQQQVQLGEMIVDLERIKTGWCVFAPGEAPEWVWDENLTVPAPKPQDGREWRRGFSVLCFSKKTFGGDGIREWATNSTGARLGIEHLYEQYEREASQNPGKVPVCVFNGGKVTKIGKGNTSVPQLTISKWVDRPTALNGGDTPGGQQAVQTPAAPPAPPTAPPAPAPASEPSMSEF